MRKPFYIILLSILIIFLIAEIIITFTQGNANPVMPKRIALINIDGEIADTTHVMELLNTYNDMAAVKAIVLRVNSPGGGVAASQEVFSLIRKIKLNGKKVVVSMSDMAASGGYYISSAADKIYANPGTITGSIGVIINFMNAEKLLGKVGLDFTTIKSGKYKDTGSFSRPVNEEDKLLMGSMIKDVLNQFVDDVVSVRSAKLAAAFGINEINEKKRDELVKVYMLANVADGRIFTGRRAKELGLIDEIGNIDDAIAGTAEMIGVHGRPLVISERKKKGFGPWLDSKIADLNPRGSSSMVMQYKMK
ncbi:MAG: signal peptide peptidase SppA [bacterium]